MQNYILQKLLTVLGWVCKMKVARKYLDFQRIIGRIGLLRSFAI
jgi:hypothetical protein